MGMVNDQLNLLNMSTSLGECLKRLQTVSVETFPLNSMVQELPFLS